MLFLASIGNLKNLEYHTPKKKPIVLSIICCKFENEDEKISKEEESIKTLKFLGLTENI